MQQQQQQLAAAAAACATLFLLYRGSAVVTQSMRWTAFLGKEGALEAERLHTAAPSTRGNTPLMFCLHIAGKKDANNHGVANAKHIVNAESQTMAQAGRKRVLLFGDTPAADVAQVSKAVSADLALSISRTEEKAFYSRGWLWKNAYYPWSGMHGSPVKPFTVRWLATLAPPEVRYLWVVEDDVLFTGDWEGFFSSYEDAELGEARGTKRGSLGGSNGGATRCSNSVPESRSKHSPETTPQPTTTTPITTTPTPTTPVSNVGNTAGAAAHAGRGPGNAAVGLETQHLHPHPHGHQWRGHDHQTKPNQTPPRIDPRQLFRDITTAAATGNGVGSTVGVGVARNTIPANNVGGVTNIQLLNLGEHEPSLSPSPSPSPPPPPTPTPPPQQHVRETAATAATAAVQLHAATTSPIHRLGGGVFRYHRYHYQLYPPTPA